jgi:hypothetical protein
MILAKELDVDFDKVALEHAPPNDKLYGNPIFGIQVTGNSNSIRSFWKPLRGGGYGAAHAGSGGGTTMASRSGQLLDLQQRRQSRTKRTHGQLR